MQINNDFIQIASPQMEQVLMDAQAQGTELAEKMLKMNAMQQIDISQLNHMATLVDVYA